MIVDILNSDDLNNIIAFYDNLGAENCDETIIKYKGWKIITE